MAKKLTSEELRWELKELENEVTERKRPEQALRESIKQLRTEQDLFKEAILAISHPFYAIDARSYKIIMANPAAIALYGDFSDHPFCYFLDPFPDDSLLQQGTSLSLRNHKGKKATRYGGTHSLR